jgi:hypothetical protein
VFEFSLAQICFVFELMRMIKIADIVNREKTLFWCDAKDNLVVAFDKLTHNKVHALLVMKDGKYVAFLGMHI